MYQCNVCKMNTLDRAVVPYYTKLLFGKWGPLIKKYRPVYLCRKDLAKQFADTLNAYEKKLVFFPFDFKQYENDYSHAYIFYSGMEIEKIPYKARWEKEKKLYKQAIEVIASESHCVDCALPPQYAIISATAGYDKSESYDIKVYCKECGARKIEKLTLSWLGDFGKEEGSLEFLSNEKQADGAFIYGAI